MISYAGLAFSSVIILRQAKFLPTLKTINPSICKRKKSNEKKREDSKNQAF